MGSLAVTISVAILIQTETGNSSLVLSHVYSLRKHGVESIRTNNHYLVLASILWILCVGTLKSMETFGL